MTEKIKLMVFGLRLGIIVFPLFYTLDYFVYPDHKYILLIIRLCISLYLWGVLLILDKIPDRYFNLLIFISVFLTGFSISAMCLVTGEGFASPYYSGLLQVIISTSLLCKIPPKLYALMMLAVIGQHFMLLSFLPWVLKDLLMNLLAVGVFSIVAVFIHNFVFEILEENQSLKGILPICAHCKKIRDDTGYWNRIEAYIQKHSEAEFTHSMCPDCSDKLYGKEDWYIKMKKEQEEKSKALK